jgi:hypothetical protein
MKLDKLKSSNMNENGSLETHVVLMTGLSPGYSEHNLTALSMIFKASDKSCGGVLPHTAERAKAWMTRQISLPSWGWITSRQYRRMALEIDAMRVERGHRCRRACHLWF